MAIKNPKKKGYALEHKIVQECRKRDLSVVRAWASDGKSIGQESDVDVVIEAGYTTYRVQAKSRKAISSYILPSKNADIQVIKGDYIPAHAVLPLTDLLDLLILKDYAKDINESRNDD